jgi:hypothetical protein
MLNKNKILIISLDLPPLGGGQGVCVENLSQQLSDRGYNVTILTTRSNERKECKFKIKEISYKVQNPIIFLDFYI